MKINETFEFKGEGHGYELLVFTYEVNAVEVGNNTPGYVVIQPDPHGNGKLLVNGALYSKRYSWESDKLPDTDYMFIDRGKRLVLGNDARELHHDTLMCKSGAL